MSDQPKVTVSITYNNKIYTRSELLPADKKFNYGWPHYACKRLKDQIIEAIVADVEAKSI